MLRHLFIIIAFVSSTIIGQFVDFTVTMSTHEGQFTPENSAAIWVTDNNDNFIKTLLIAAGDSGGGGYKHALLEWKAASSYNTVDAITRASYMGHGIRSASWDCKDLGGNEVPDGNYKIHFEMTETNSFADPVACGGPYAYVSFVKGAVDNTSNPPDVAYSSPSCILNLNPTNVYTVFSNMEVVYSAPGPGMFEFSAPFFGQKENNSTASVTIARRRGKSGVVSVDCQFRDSTATNGADYTGTTSTIAFADNDYAPKTVSVPILNDALQEPTESAILELSSPTGGAALGNLNKALLYLFDDDNGVPTNGLKAHWSFEAGNGLLVPDESGSGNTGEIGEENWTAGKVGLGMNYDGIDDYMEIPSSSSLSLSGPITIAAWINLGRNNWGQTFVRSPGQYTLWIQPDNQIRFADALGHWIDSPGNAAPLNTWTHVAVTFSGTVGNSLTTSNAKIYVDGVSVGNQVSGAWGAQSRAETAVLIGNRWLTGKLDEVYIYDRALTQTEVQALFNVALSQIPIHDGRHAVSKTSEINIYPNPVGQFATLVLPKTGKSADIIIYDIHGKEIERHTNISAKHFRWEPLAPVSSEYFARIVTGDKVYRRKIILQK